MSDKLLDATQLLNGLAILISFYVGYKYGLSTLQTKLRVDSSNKLKREKVICGGNYKMILIVRNDLKMGKGKIAAQCGHAAVGAYQKALQRRLQILYDWEENGSPKIAVKVESERELVEIKKKADSCSLNTCLIYDAGRTQVSPNTKTVLAIGPANNNDVDKITGHLKLL